MNIETLSALAEPNRLRIVELLRDAPRSVGEIAERLDLRQPQVSKHLKVLSTAGLVGMRAQAQQRIYQLEGRPLAELNEWLGSFRVLWERRYQRLETLLHDLQSDQSDRGITP